MTGDVSAKYEIEAYLAAAKVLVETNLRRKILSRSFARLPALVQLIEGLIGEHSRAYWPVANQIRNHAYHLNPAFRDLGFEAVVEKRGEQFVVSLNHAYEDAEGKSVDLARVFEQAHSSTRVFILAMRDLLLGYWFLVCGPPKNGTYLPVQSQFGNFCVGLGPNGYEISGAATSMGANPADVCKES
jgi:hypothetical protein